MSEIPNNDYSFYTDSIFPAREDLALAISCLTASDRAALLSSFEKLADAYYAAGHYEREFFFSMYKDSPQTELNGMSISEVLIQDNPQTASLLDFLCQEDPALAILVFKGPSNSGYNDRIFVDNEFDDQDPNSQILYAEDCLKDSMNYGNTPTTTSFVIREAESYLRPESVTFNDSRAYPMDTKIIEFPASTSCISSIKIYDYPVPPSELAPPTGGDPNDPDDPDPNCFEDCDRDCIDCKENMRRFRARKDYEGWGKGNGEFNWHIIYAENVSYSVDDDGNVALNGESLDYVVKRSEGVEDNNEWRYENFDIIRWDLDRPDADRMKYILYEDDAGKTRDINIPLSFSVKIKIKGVELTRTFETSIPIRITRRDDFIGESIVDYCDNIGFEYKPSSTVDFDCNERCN